MKELSRQRRWQLKRQQEGLCTMCGHGKLNFSKSQCDICLVKSGLRNNKKISKKRYRSRYNIA